MGVLCRAANLGRNIMTRLWSRQRFQRSFDQLKSQRLVHQLWTCKPLKVAVVGAFALGNAIALSAAVRNSWESFLLSRFSLQPPLAQIQSVHDLGPVTQLMAAANGRPKPSFLPTAEEVWECEVAIVGGSLGGIAAAAHAMEAGATTCVIELTPWLGGQVSSQGVSAIDESRAMRAIRHFSQSWLDFKWLIQQQLVELPSWAGLPSPQKVADLNSCWVGALCFVPKAGAVAAQEWLQFRSHNAPNSRWETSVAFKGAEFDTPGKRITAIYAVKRVPRNPDYVPEGRLSRELHQWYAWSDDEVFDKIPIRLQPPPGKHMMVIDATDTGELIAWAGVPYRVGSESNAVTGEIGARRFGNPECTQAFTYPFVLAIHNDKGASRNQLKQIQPGYSKAEHRREYDLERFPMFIGPSVFHYRRIVSTTMNSPLHGGPSPGDMTLINWNRGNDWYWMDPPLILSDEKLEASGQYENWMGGLSVDALREAENHALLFSEWLMETQANPDYPLTHLSGRTSPLGTVSGLSMYPYIREGRRILGRAAYGQDEFMIREADIRVDMSGERNFSSTAVGVTHYDVDIHGCRYRDGRPTGEAQGASVKEHLVRPVILPLESLIPQGIDNLLIGGKSIAVTHIVNAVTRVHYGEWSVGAAAGATSAWLVTSEQAPQSPAEIVSEGHMPALQQYLQEQGVRFTW
jgi:hypothetical protein